MTRAFRTITFFMYIPSKTIAWFPPSTTMSPNPLPRGLASVSVSSLEKYLQTEVVVRNR